MFPGPPKPETRAQKKERRTPKTGTRAHSPKPPFPDLPFSLFFFAFFSGKECLAFLSVFLSGTGDSQRDSRESIRANHSQLRVETPIFIAHQADSHESLEELWSHFDLPKDPSVLKNTTMTEKLVNYYAVVFLVACAMTTKLLENKICTFKILFS